MAVQAFLHAACFILASGAPSSRGGHKQVGVTMGSALSLLETSTRLRTRRSKQSIASGNKASLPKGSYWFGNFDQSESTLNPEGVNAELRIRGEVLDHGWSNGYHKPLKNTEGLGYEWFHESPSGSYSQAWQTHYPAVGAGVAGGRDAKNQPWRYTPEGWVQDYTAVRSSDPRIASWFDSSVVQRDGYGRPRLPDEGKPRSFLNSEIGVWTHRAVNTTLSCAAIGCTANTTLIAYDPKAEYAQACRLSVHVHPTDFDDDWSKENIETMSVNGYTVKVACDPMARGCNHTAWRPLYACVRDLDVTHLMNDTEGKLQIQAKLGRMVDECPYNGNLLNGIATVSCMVQPRTDIHEETRIGINGTTCETLPSSSRQFAQALVFMGMNSTKAESLVQGVADLGLSDEEISKLTLALDDIPPGFSLDEVLYAPRLPFKTKASQLSPELQTLRGLTYGTFGSTQLQCAKPGCAAKALIQVDPTPAKHMGRCTLSINLHQTDFDDSSNENIEYVLMGSPRNATTLLTNSTPGRNPCTSEYQGTKLLESSRNFALLSGVNVTAEVLKFPYGDVELQAKISEMVDECAVDGMLLSAEASIACMPPKLVGNISKWCPMSSSELESTPSATTFLQTRRTQRHRRNFLSRSGSTTS